jgi:hypothetical protein
MARGTRELPHEAWRTLPETPNRQLGWFHLRLTRQELENILNSASGEGLIEIAGDRAPDGRPLDDEDLRWRLTEKGEKLRAPRGAGFDDLRLAFFELARRYLGNVKDLSALAALLFAAGLGITVVDNGTLSHLLLIVGVWSFCLALTLSAYRDQRALTSCVNSWPRLADYRPERVKCERGGWTRTPGPAALMASATLLSLIVGWAVVWFGQNPRGDGHWLAIGIVGTGIAVAIARFYAVAERRGRRLRDAYDAELDRRRNLFAPSPS